MNAAPIVGPYRMVGLRWVACWTLLALSCGRTANSDGNFASGGSPSAIGGNGGAGTASSGSGPTPMSAGAAGEPGDAGPPLCPVTPAAGQWFARGPDPYGFELVSDGVQLSGIGCLGGLPSEPSPFGCSPLSMLADKGRSVDFVWNMNRDLGLGYSVKMELTISPDRTAMAGRMWGSASGVDEEGRDIVLVRYPADQPLPAATLCSEGVPSGACFLGPLRSDYIDQTRVVELGSGNLLLVWFNQRGLGRQIASARFDAATGSWQKAELLDDGAAPIDPSALMLTATSDGSAVVAYVQENAVIARTYAPDASAWSEPHEFAKADDPSVRLRPVSLFADQSGDATLLVSAQAPGWGTLSAHDYDSATRGWQEPHFIDDSVTLPAYDWTAASDDAGNAIVVLVHGELDGVHHELWFSRRSPAGKWTAAAPFYAVDAHLMRPAVAIGKNGTAVVTWQEFLVRLGSNTYSFETAAWGEPSTVTSQPNTDNRAVAFDDAGAPVAYFQCNDCVSSDAQKKSTFLNGGWSAPQTTTAQDARADTHAVTGSGDDIQVARLKPRPGESALPPLQRPRCEGY